jgi:hypothetical protein
MKTFEITARKRPEDLDASYGTEEATSARELMARILGDLDHYHIDGAAVTEIIVATDDDWDWDEPSARAFRIDGDGWVINEYDGDGNEDEIAEMTPDMDMIWKTPYQASYYDVDSDTLENLSVWIRDEGDMVTYYLRRNGEFIDCTNNDSCSFDDIPDALVVNARGGISTIDIVPFKGYVVNGGEAFEHLADAEREARK